MNTIHTPIGIGLIGCGGMGRSLVRRLLELDPRLQVKALLDPDPRSIEATLAELATPPVVCEDLEAMWEVPGVDWVMIASWNCQHAEQTLAAFAAGKEVFCQKPLATNLNDALRMATAWRSSERHFGIGFTLRFSPHYRKIHELLRDGAIGDLISMEFNETLDFNHGGYIMGDWRRLEANAGSHLLEKCCHDIDLANWMTGSRAAQVASFGGRRFFLPENAAHIERIGRDPEGKAAYQTWRGLVKADPFTSDKDIVDHQVAILEYANGVCATFHTNLNAGIPERRMLLLGSEGAIRADLGTGAIDLRRIGFGTTIETVSIPKTDGHGGGDAVLAKEIAAAMLHGKTPAVGLSEALESAVTCFAIDEAMKSSAVINLAAHWSQVDDALS